MSYYTPMADDPRLQQLLQQLQPFGFTFYGYDENGHPLVQGPNKQVTHINVAVSFVNEQIKKQQQQGGGGGSFETPPPMPQNIDTAGSIEKSAETAVEQKMETAQEEQQEGEQQQQQQVVQPPPVPQKAPQIRLERPKIIPYGDGYAPKSFNPESLQQTMKFIEKNSSASKQSSNKWLAVQFKKFVQEMKK